MLSRIFYKITYPRSTSKELRRREFILNILLIGSIILSGLALVSITIRFFTLDTRYIGNSPLTIVFIFCVFLSLYFLSRKGYFTVSSFILILMYLFPTIFAVYKWSIYLPQAILIFALLIVMSNILISSRFGLFITAGISVILLILGHLQSMQKVPYDLSWATSSTPGVADAGMYAFTFAVISLVSWLFNRESEKILLRAQLSELALEKERNLLEIKVEQRTKELRKVQVEKTVQLYRFAEFGKMASGFFHDFANSVNLVSLNLNELKKKDVNGLSDMKELIARAQTGLTHMEHFLAAASKQINNQNVQELFSIEQEIQQVIDILSYKARKEHVQVILHVDKKLKIVGNPVKFHQLVSNLLSNAIDSYYGSGKKNKLVSIDVVKDKNTIKITITDTGIGISERNLNHIFDPFFTTKKYKKGTGLGLSISQGIAVGEFGGGITVQSKRNKGTTFFVELKKV